MLLALTLATFLCVGADPVIAAVGGARDGAQLHHAAERTACCGSARVHAIDTPHEQGADQYENEDLELPPCAIRTFACVRRRVCPCSTPREERAPLLDTMRLNI
ncbi:MAG TPA: hypothetical protein VF846_05040 [Thermoanaerobaculia bacterium]|jgi:hypothetical protein